MLITQLLVLYSFNRAIYKLAILTLICVWSFVYWHRIAAKTISNLDLETKGFKIQTGYK